MGVVLASVAIGLVLWQTIFVLVGRQEEKWAFSLVQHTPSAADFKSLQLLFKMDKAGRSAYVYPNGTFVNSSFPAWSAILRSEPETTLDRCVIGSWVDASPEVPLGCLLHGRSSQRVDTILSTFNPHLILLGIACANAAFCVAGAIKGIRVSSYGGSGGVLGNVMYYRRTFASAFFTVFAFVISTIYMWVVDTELYRYPTIVVQLFILIPTLRFSYLYDEEDNHNFMEEESVSYEDPEGEYGGGAGGKAFDSVPEYVAWRILNHMLLVLAPLVVVVWSAMGVRIWTDVFAIALLLIVNVHAVWLLQSEVVDKGAQLIGYIAALVIPILTTALAAQLVGGPMSTWRQIMCLKPAAGLVLLVYLLSLLPARAVKPKTRLKLTSYIITLTIAAVFISINLLS